METLYLPQLMSVFMCHSYDLNEWIYFPILEPNQLNEWQKFSTWRIICIQEQIKIHLRLTHNALHTKFSSKKKEK